MRFVLALTLTLAGCASEGTLVVQVRTDLLPGAELAAVEVELDGDVTRRDASEAADWGRGVRVAELSGLANGEHRVLVRALAPGGGTLVERPVRVTIDGGVRVVTVLLTRDCAGAVCPAADPTATACLGGRCVPEGCTEETPDLCPMRECDVALDCTETASDCASVTCSASGTCFVEPDHGACDGDLRCSIDDGCAMACAPGEAVAPFGVRYGEGMGGLRDVVELASGTLAAVGTRTGSGTLEGVLLDLDDVSGAGSDLGVFPDRPLEALSVAESGSIVVAGTVSSATPGCHFQFLDTTGTADMGFFTYGVPGCLVLDMIGPLGRGFIAAGVGQDRASLWVGDGPSSVVGWTVGTDVARDFHVVAEVSGGFVAVGALRSEGGQSIFLRQYASDLSSRLATPDGLTPSWMMLRVVGARETPLGFEVFGTVSDDGASYRRLHATVDPGLSMVDVVESGRDVRVEDIVFLADGGYALAETTSGSFGDSISVSRWDAAHRLLWSGVYPAEEPTRATAITMSGGDLVVVGSIGAAGAEHYALRITDPACGP